MFLLILTAAAISIYIYVNNKEITQREFLIMTGAITASVLFVYGLAIIPFPNDTYFESGRLTATIYHPYFIEKYEEEHERCTGSGDDERCTTYYTTEYAKHQPYWEVEDSLGDNWRVSKEFHNTVKADFGNKVTVTQPDKCTHDGEFYSGDPNLYTYYNVTNSYNYPTNRTVFWHNPVKNKKSLFKSKTDLKMKYPSSKNHYSSERLLDKEGTNFTEKDWEILNTKVFEISRANLILMKLPNSESANKLEDAWQQGSKNDLIICVVGDYSKPDFVKVFGWTKSALVKLQLETYILDKGVKKENFSEIKDIIKKYYEPFDFKKFNYMKEAPSIWTFITAFIVACLVGVFCYKKFSNNYEQKEI